MCRVGTGTGTIQDDDSASFSIGNASVVEGDSGTANAVFTISLTPADAATQTVRSSTSSGTATSGQDFVAINNTTLTFLAGETAKSITVVVNGDTTDGPDETFTVTLSQASTSIGTGTGTGTIVNDDLPMVSIGDISVTEGTGAAVNNAVLTVSLSTACTDPSCPATVGYATANGTALAGSDYTTTSGTVTFNTGETAKPITIAILGDSLDEPDETFTVNLSNPTNATTTPGDPQAVVTIVDDDLPSLSIANASVIEGNTGTANAVFTVTMSSANLQQAVTVGYATWPGTATANTDYTTTSGTLTISSGSTTGAITVAALGDTSYEDNETFTVALSSPSGATIPAGQGSATGTILDDDGPALTISDATAAEGNSGTTNAVFSVRLATTSAFTITVGYATADGDAVEGIDYVAKQGTLTFNPGASTQLITVAVLGDTISENNETFTVALSNPLRASCGGWLRLPGDRHDHRQRRPDRRSRLPMSRRPRTAARARRVVSSSPRASPVSAGRP